MVFWKGHVEKESFSLLAYACESVGFPLLWLNHLFGEEAIYKFIRISAWKSARIETERMSWRHRSVWYLLKQPMVIDLSYPWLSPKALWRQAIHCHPNPTNSVSLYPLLTSIPYLLTDWDGHSLIDMIRALFHGEVFGYKKCSWNELTTLDLWCWELSITKSWIEKRW